MGPTSPQAALATSPNQFNHFAPLSPDAVNTTLDVDPEMTAILGIAPKQAPAAPADYELEQPAPRLPSGPLIVYSRAEILRLCRRSTVPTGMGPLESWYGAPQKTQHVDDPAIASIAPAGRRGGGFGEGFGFGGGIGGRVIGRGGGTRNIGQPGDPHHQQQHHQPVDPAIAEQSRGNAFSGQMGKFAVRPAGERGPMRLGGDREEQQPRSGGDRDRRRRDDDWRRGERQAPPHQHQRNGDRRGPGGYGRYEEDNSEPAWMNDDEDLSAPLEDPAIASASSADPGDPLVKFVPGEDMIAAHKRAMKARQAGPEAGDSWRPAEKPLVSFFGGAAPQQPAAPAKPREVNLQSYFKHKVVDDDEPQKQEKEEVEETSAFQSRFQRFFGSSGGPSGGQGGAPPVPVSASPVAPVQERQYERQQERQYERQQERQYERQQEKQYERQERQYEQPAESPYERQQYERQPDRYEQQQQQQHQAPLHARSPVDQPSPVSGGRVDDHMAKLMGLLSTKGASPGPRAESSQHYQGPPPGISPYQQSPSVETSSSDFMSARSRHDHSPDNHMIPPPPPHFSPPPVDPRSYPYPAPPGFPRGGPGPSMSGELPPRQFYDQRSPPDNRPPPDLLQLLQGQGGRPMPPPMGMLPPHPMYPPPPPGPSPDDLLRSLQSGTSPSPGAPPGYLMRGPPGPNGHPHSPHGGHPGFAPPPPMQGFLPPPQGYYGGPPGVPGVGPGPGPGPGPGQRMPPPGMMYGGPPPPGPGGPGQDMLAALLAPRS